MINQPQPTIPTPKKACLFKRISKRKRITYDIRLEIIRLSKEGKSGK